MSGMGRTRLQTLFEMMSIVGVLGGLAVGLWYGPRLPPSIPIHFDLRGDPDGWGSRSFFAFFTLMVPVVYVVLTLLARHPRILNYPVAITPENAETQYRLMRTFLAGIKTVMVLGLAYLLWRTADVGRGGASGLGRMAVLAFLVSLATMIVVYVLAAISQNRHVRAASA